MNNLSFASTAKNNVSNLTLSSDQSAFKTPVSTEGSSFKEMLAKQVNLDKQTTLDQAVAQNQPAKPEQKAFKKTIVPQKQVEAKAPSKLEKNTSPTQADANVSKVENTATTESAVSTAERLLSLLDKAHQNIDQLKGGDIKDDLSDSTKEVSDKSVITIIAVDPSLVNMGLSNPSLNGVAAGLAKSAVNNENGADATLRSSTQSVAELSTAQLNIAQLNTAQQGSSDKVAANSGKLDEKERVGSIANDGSGDEAQTLEHEKSGTNKPDFSKVLQTSSEAVVDKKTVNLGAQEFNNYLVAKENQTGQTKAESQFDNSLMMLSQPTNMQNTAQLSANIMANGIGNNNQIGVPFGKTGWDQAISQRIMLMVGSSEQTATLTLNPPDLGPLQVVVHVHNDQADTTFITDHTHVREALENSLGTLQDMMKQAGINMGTTQFSNSQNSFNNQQSQQQEQQSNNQSRQSNALVGDDRGAMSEIAPKASSVSLRRGLVDTFA